MSKVSVKFVVVHSKTNFVCFWSAETNVVSMVTKSDIVLISLVNKECILQRSWLISFDNLVELENRSTCIVAVFTNKNVLTFVISWFFMAFNVFWTTAIMSNILIELLEEILNSHVILETFWLNFVSMIQHRFVQVVSKLKSSWSQNYN